MGPPPEGVGEDEDRSGHRIFFLITRLPAIEGR